MRAMIDATVIGELRRRVIAHNEANPRVKAKLGELRKVYERGCRRSNSPSRALEKVDGYLDALAKSDFDEHKHHRDGDGEFSAVGALPASPAAHQAAQSHSAGYRAVTTDVIPEQRYEAAGSLLRDSVSLGAGVGIVGSLASKTHGKAVSRAAAAVTGSVGRIVGGTAGAIVGQAAHRGSQALRRTTGYGPNITSSQAKGVRRWAADMGDTAGRKVGAVSTKAASAVVRGAMGTAGDATTLHPAAVSRYRDKVAAAVRMGRPLRSAAAQARPAALLHNRRLRFNRKAGAFGVLAGAVGLGIRSQWKDSIIDPAAAGHLMDAFAFRSVQKAVGASEELGGIRTEMTEALAKYGPAGGSMQNLSRWLDAGGGEDLALRKAGAPWGVGITRLFTAGASLAGAAAGGGAGFGVSRATQPHASGEGFQEADHPRDHDGKFTSKAGRDRRFAQVGSLLGGAAAGIAVFAALRRHNARYLPPRVAELKRKTLALMQGAEARKYGAGKRAKETTGKRVQEMIDGSPAFRKERDEIDRVKTLGASDPGVMQNRLRNVYHDGIAEIVSAHPEVEILQGKEWRKLEDVMRDEGNPSKQIAKAKIETAKALAVMSEADVQRMVNGVGVGRKRVGGLPDGVREIVHGHLQDMRIQVGGVSAAMREHSQKVTAALREVDARLNEGRAAHAQLGVATAALKSAPEDEAAKAAFNVAEAASATAKAAHLDAQKVAARLRDNPTGVVNPFTGQPVPAPTQHEIDGRLERLRQDNTDRAGKIVEAENVRIVAQQRQRIAERHNNLLAATAMRAAVNGSPRLARAATKGLAVLAEAEQAAGAKLASAQVAHGLNQPDFDALKLATRYGPGGVLRDPPLTVMSAERRKFLRDNAASIRTNHETTAKKLAAAEETYGTARTRRDAANAVFQQAVEAAGMPKKNSPLIRGQLGRDLRRAQEELAKPLRAAFNDPSGKKLQEWAASLKPGLASAARRAKAGVASGVKRSYEDLLTRDSGNGKGPQFSPGKAMANGALVGSIITAAKVDLQTVKDRLFGDEDAKAAAKARRRELRIEQKRDPITGAGYFGLSVPDPNAPDERTLIWGEHYSSDSSPARPLHAGGSMTDLRARMAMVEQQRADRDRLKAAQGLVSNAGMGAMTNVPENLRGIINGAVTKLSGSNGLAQYQTVQGGPVATLRSDAHKSGDDRSFDDAANHAAKVLRSNHSLTPTGAASPEAWHSALADLFSFEGRSLTARQAYREMTGYTEDGNIVPHRIFGNNPGFRDAGAGEAMGAEVTRVLEKTPALTAGQAMNMMRAVAVVAHVKKLPPPVLADLFKRITAAAPQTPVSPSPSPFMAPLGGNRPAAPAPAPVQVAPPEPAPAAPGVTALTVVPGGGAGIDLKSTASIKTKRAFNDQEGLRLGEMIASKQGPKFGVFGDPETAELANSMIGFAREMHANSDSMSELQAFTAVQHAFSAMKTLRPEAELGDFMFSAGSKDERSAENATFAGLLLREARKQDRSFMAHLGKAELLDRIDALEKMSMDGWLESLHPRAAAGEATGGEFVEASGGNGSSPGHGTSPGGKITAEGIEAGGKYAGKAEAQSGSVQSWAHPVRLGTEFGGALGTEAALRGAQTVARFLPGTVGKVAALGLEGVSAMVGGDYGSEAGNAAGSAAYTAATGKKAPGYNPPEYHDVGEGLAAAGGGMGGGLWGNAAGMTAGAFLGEAVGGTAGALVGGPVGAVALGAAAGWAGEKASQGIYSFFAGYDKPAVEKAMTRFKPKG